MGKRRADRRDGTRKLPAPPPMPRAERESTSANAADRSAPRLLPSLSLALFAIWMVASTFRTVINQDIWIHLRVGQDILATGKIPRVDQYSAVAAGRPFIAHEWLSGVVFALMDRAAGGASFSFLCAGIALGCVVLMLLSLPKPLREHAITIPLLVLCAYAIDYRITHRPHVFSLLLLCAVVFAMERWRSSRRLRDLVWLVPLHGLWANLHGAFMYGVVLLGLLAGSIGVSMLTAHSSTHGGERRYSKWELGAVAAVAMGSLLAALLNPYGTAILETSIGVSSSGLLKQYVTEWQSPFLASSFFRTNDSYEFWIYCAVLLLLWGGILLRARDKPWVDMTLALAVTVQSALANRFIADAAIVGFPIIVRSWAQLLGRAVEPRMLARRPWLELALLVPLLGTTLAYGHAYGPAPERHRPIGIGYGGKIPNEEIAFMAEHGYEGAIYNEKIEDGAPIIYHLFPRIRPVMDARLDVYGEELLMEWGRSRWNKQLFDEYVRKYDVDLALIERDRPIARDLLQDPEWQPVYGSGRWLLFVRRQ
jgi:hypothetical protein